jgi:hypothetical protein
MLSGFAARLAATNVGTLCAFLTAMVRNAGLGFDIGTLPALKARLANTATIDSSDLPRAIYQYYDGGSKHPAAT